MPTIIVGLCALSDAAITPVFQGKRGDFGTADTLGLPVKSICQIENTTSSGWKAHGEVA
jgi:hypothetical protein